MSAAATTSHLRNYSYQFWSALGFAIKCDAMPLAVAIGFCILAWILLSTIGVYMTPFSSIQSFFLLILTAAFFLVFVRAGWSLFRHRPDSPIRHLAKFFGSELSPQNIGRLLPMIVAASIFIPTFSAVKGSISRFALYRWDDYWINVDRVIHGDDVWKLLHPVLGFPFVTFVLNVAYHLWLVLIIACLLFFIFTKRDGILRRQWLTSYFLCWGIIGSGMALLFASVGPCFLLPILHRDDFVPLMDYLHHTNTQWPIWALAVQARLLEQYTGNSTQLGAGITAMPSMHVSMAVLFWLGLRKISLFLNWLLGIFFVMILVGSVHLGYHYAVDGYVAIIITIIIWICVGRVLPSAKPEGEVIHRLAMPNGGL